MMGLSEKPRMVDRKYINKMIPLGALRVTLQIIQIGINAVTLQSPGKSPQTPIDDLLFVRSQHNSGSLLQQTGHFFQGLLREHGLLRLYCRMADPCHAISHQCSCSNDSSRLNSLTTSLRCTVCCCKAAMARTVLSTKSAFMRTAASI